MIRKAAILAGGLGTRLMEETESRPKPMVEIGGKPMLWHIMQQYSAHGINEFVICLGYKGYVIKEYFANYYLHMADVTIDMAANGKMQVHRGSAEPWKVTLVDTGAATMTGGRLKRVRDYLGEEPFCMTYGDAVSTVDITASIAFHQAHGKLATVTAVHPPARFGSLELDGTVVRGFREKPVGESLINGGFFVLQSGALDEVRDDTTIWEHGPMERLAASGNLHAFRHDGFWQPMDTLREKRLLEELWESGKAPWMTRHP